LQSLCCAFGAFFNKQNTDFRAKQICARCVTKMLQKRKRRKIIFALPKKSTFCFVSFNKRFCKNRFAQKKGDAIFVCSAFAESLRYGRLNACPMRAVNEFPNRLLEAISKIKSEVSQFQHEYGNVSEKVGNVSEKSYSCRIRVETASAPDAILR
jgi:hypothetical protein